MSMRYWVFINNSIEGPLTIKEIVEKNYISPDLLVCPFEMSATKPSSWYFAKELSEFDLYLGNEKRIKIAVKDSANELSFLEDFFDFEFKFREEHETPSFEEILEIERKKIEEKEKEEYKKKILSFERNIRELNHKLKEAFKSIERYEKALEEKDLIIQNLEKEIEELKRLREEDKKIFEEKIRIYEDALTHRNESIVKKAEISTLIENKEREDNCNDKDKKSENNVVLKKIDINFETIDPTVVKSEVSKGNRGDINSGIVEVRKEQDIVFSSLSESQANEYNNDEKNIKKQVDVEGEKKLISNELGGNENEVQPLNKVVNIDTNNFMIIESETLKDDGIIDKDIAELKNEQDVGLLALTEPKTESNTNKESDKKQIDVNVKSELENKEFKISPEIDLSSLSKKLEKIDNNNFVNKADRHENRELEIDIFKNDKNDFEKSLKNTELNLEVSVEKEEERFQQFNFEDKKEEIVYKKFEPIEIKEIAFASQENILDKFEIPVSSFESVKPIERDDLFQIADINLEKVETRLDIVTQSKIEPLVADEKKSVDEIKIEELENFKDDDKSHSLEKGETLPLKDIQQERVDFKAERLISKNKEKNIDSTEKENTSLKTLDKDYNKDEKKDDSFLSHKGSKSTKKLRFTNLIVLASFGIILFFFGLIYILRSGRDFEVKQAQTKGIYSQTSKKDDAELIDKSDKKMDNVKEKQEEELRIAKINQNVQRAIDIVKNYNLGDGKGTIERWLSNSVTLSSGKEEWNATYLSGNLFVVQYRFLRFKSEPIVYLFEVDVEKNEIVRGINNNAINLLAGSKKEKNLDKAISKKFDKHIEKDEDMF